jgi:hypothetical protein
MTTRSKTRLRLHALIVALLLALSWVSVPISLATWEPDVCEMECCIAAGHCCCATRHAYVKGREPKPGEIRLSLETTLTAPCPASCAGSTTAAQKLIQRATPAPQPLPTLVSIPLPYDLEQIPPGYTFAARPSAPRAPPLHRRSLV